MSAGSCIATRLEFAFAAATFCARGYRPAALALTVFALLTPTHLQAQDTTAAKHTLCYRGHPMPTCDRFVLTEIGYYQRAAGSRQTFISTYTERDGAPHTLSYSADDIGSQLSWELGMMANRGPRTAVGGTLLIGVGNSGADVGLKARYRRWLAADGTALDVGAGVVGGILDDRSGNQQAFGVTGDVALNASDFGAIVLRVDILRRGGRTGSAIFGGVRLGSKPALVGTGLVAVGFALLLSALADSNY